VVEINAVKKRPLLPSPEMQNLLTLVACRQIGHLQVDLKLM
jgi:hypothetical protein